MENVVVENERPVGHDVLLRRLALWTLELRTEASTANATAQPLHIGARAHLHLVGERRERRVGAKCRRETLCVEGHSGVCDHHITAGAARAPNRERFLTNAVGRARASTSDREGALIHGGHLGEGKARQRERERDDQRECAHVGNMIPAAQGRVHSSSAGVRKIRSLMRCRMRSYIARPFSAVASDGRPIDPALSFGTRRCPRR